MQASYEKRRRQSEHSDPADPAATDVQHHDRQRRVADDHKPTAVQPQKLHHHHHHPRGSHPRPSSAPGFPPPKTHHSATSTLPRVQPERRPVKYLLAAVPPPGQSRLQNSAARQVRSIYPPWRIQKSLAGNYTCSRFPRRPKGTADEFGGSRVFFRESFGIS